MKNFVEKNVNIFKIIKKKLKKKNIIKKLFKYDVLESMFLKDYDYKPIVELENENFQNQLNNKINLYDQAKKFNNNSMIFRSIVRYEKNNFFS